MDTEVTPEVRDLQDTTVTLRLNIPAYYKKLLLKECEIEHQRIIETDVCVIKQPILELKKIERIEKHFPSCTGASDVQEVNNLLNILQKLFPKK
ncbi:uncharacterized protein LOC128732300 [Anopheles nili]|uniref:uncharacterized protein LOC128732300 n=1 Tax=Anopheles nili TaxID=185578 RepID=UPI00237A31B9|nr:uncharacterized protein LOC128732300 [Anopheles nili]